VLSGAGDGIFWVALLVTLSDQPRFGWLLVLAVLARLAPRALLSIPAGTLIDRTRIRPLLVAVDVSRGVLMVVLAVLTSVGLPAWALLAFVLASYVIGVPTRPGLMVALLCISDESRLASANASLSTLRQVMTFVGPLLGVAVAAWSTSSAFAINGVSFLISAALIASVRGLDRPSIGVADAWATSGAPSRRRWLVASFVEGLAPIRNVSGLSGLVGLISAMYFVRGMEMVVHILVVRDLLDAEPDAIGYLAGAIGLGAVLAMPVAARVAKSTFPNRPLLAAVVLTSVPTAALASISSLVGAAGILVLVGAGMVVFEVISVVTIQRTVAESELGRVFGAVNSASNTGKLAGAIAAPALAALLGTATTLVATAAMLVVVTTLVAPSLSRIARDASARGRALEPITEVLASLGLLDGAQRATLERLAAAVTACDVRAGTFLIREGDEPDDLYVARSGVFVVSVAGRAVNELGVDEWFGEIGLIKRIPRTASVMAKSDASVWRIPGRTFTNALEESGAAPSALVQGIADRLAMNRELV
jgi:Cyclic nucleotide-binding domain/Transmembrane secretion effector